MIDYCRVIQQKITTKEYDCVCVGGGETKFDYRVFIL